MLVAFGCYTTLVVCLNLIASGGGSNLIDPNDPQDFSSEEVRERTKGSKIVVISEQAMLNTIYLIKTCMLFMYTRLTMGLRQQRIVKGIAIYVACGWVGTEFAFFFACRPFHDYWAVPTPNRQCTTYEKYAISQATFNISSDLLMLAIMLPLLLQTNLPLKQKFALVAIFGMGSFVIVAAILTKVFNLSDPYSTVYMLWYFREASTALYVSNLPLIWPLLREYVPWLGNISLPRVGYSSKTRDASRASGKGGFANISMSQMSRSRSTRHNMGVETDIEPTESAEKINKPSFQGEGILTETTVEVAYDEGARSEADDIDLEKSDPQHHRPGRAPYLWESSNPPNSGEMTVTPAAINPNHKRFSSHASSASRPTSRDVERPAVGRAL
jgi:hypothetical protein